MKRGIILASIAAVLALLVCVFCGIFLVQYYRETKLPSSLVHAGEEGDSFSGENLAKAPVFMEALPPESPDTPDSEQVWTEYERVNLDDETAQTIRIPVDFSELEQLNTDIYAWISVPDTVIDYPVLQASDGADWFYLNHGADAEHYVNGSIFSESVYNSRSFEDPVVILYGHDIRNSVKMFSQLNNFADAAYFDEHPDFYIYTPEKVYHYSVFAALPFGTQHLMSCGYFSTEESFTDFFGSLEKRHPYSSNYRPDLFPSVEDQVVILSTCFAQNHAQRFLVMGVCAETWELKQ